MKRPIRRILFVFGGLATLLLVAGVAVILLFGRTAPSPLPNPNGYDDLIRAGQAVTGNLNGLADGGPNGLFRELMATNAEALRLLRVGLSRECSVPTDAAIANFGAVTRDLMAFRSLARLLKAEGRLAEMENRPADAAQSYLDAMRLGTQIGHGGLLIHRLVGIACESVGNISFVKLLPKYLHRMPIDPFTGHPLVYTQTGTNWLLYSVGPDRVDDGGKPAGKIISDKNATGFGGTKSGDGQKQKGDIFYDSPW